MQYSILMDDSTLQRIHKLQTTDKPAAEALLLDFIRQIFPDLNPASVELRPLAVSLNSFNGFLTLADGRKLFFKTHIEPGSVVGEYYNSQLLSEAGYPILKPLYASTEYGKQLLIYDLVEWPSLFDVARAIEKGERDDLPALREAQNQADDHLLQIYRRTLEWQAARDAAKSPVHQLFHHRLGGRYDEFYKRKRFFFPGNKALAWETLCGRRWEINGVQFNGTLGETIQAARRRLRPDQAGWSVIGHGDAHNGNVFYKLGGLLYFDPAFGGRHHPLLDLAKPLFHNVFADWMYHPHEVAAALSISYQDDGKLIHVEHNHAPTEVRRMFFASKVGRVLWPLVEERDGRISRFADWRAYLKSALLCCPLLTMNLADRNRFPPEIGLLGLCYVVQMGMDRVGEGSSFLDRML